MLQEWGTKVPLIRARQAGVPTGSTEPHASHRKHGLEILLLGDEPSLLTGWDTLPQSSKQIHSVLQQLLLGLAWQAEGAVVRVGNARVAERSTQLLEVGFLDGVPAGVHGRGGVPGGQGRQQQSGLCKIPFSSQCWAAQSTGLPAAERD